MEKSFKNLQPRPQRWELVVSLFSLLSFLSPSLSLCSVTRSNYPNNLTWEQNKLLQNVNPVQSSSIRLIQYLNLRFLTKFKVYSLFSLFFLPWPHLRATFSVTPIDLKVVFRIRLHLTAFSANLVCQFRRKSKLTFRQPPITFSSILIKSWIKNPVRQPRKRPQSWQTIGHDS